MRQEGEGYERLSGLDQSFLHFETRTSYMHVALTAIFSAGSLGGPEGGIDIGRIRQYVASRLHLIPRYRQRLHHVPLTNDPVWVDDESFDLDHHVRHTRLPRPGTDRQLRSLSARLLERPLDRRRPLWEMWFMEGLAGGRFAMLCKVHHCMVDGIAGIDLLAALLSAAPEVRIERPEPWEPAPIPSGARMLRDDARRRAGASLDFLRTLPGVVAGDARASLGPRLGSLWGFVRAGVQRAAETPFNQPIGPHRRMEWLDIDLAEAKAVKQRLGGTLNDVVLAIVAGAMRRLFADRALATSGEFRALIPVSTRSASERGETGNRVSAWIATLPIREARALERYRSICKITSSYRASHEERGAAVLIETAEWTGSLALGIAVRLISQTRAFNVIVTNVPGPQLPFYLLDAPMVAAYPHLPLFENQGLAIALLSYAGRLYFGLVGDWELVPDLDRVAGWFAASFAELRKAAGLDQTVAEAVRMPPREVAAHAFA